MAHASNYLKLVGHDDPHTSRAWHHDEAARAIAAENRSAARSEPVLEPTDPRWVLATRTYASLDGTTLAPEKRDRLLRTAQKLGVRPFDANVIIAIVQDQARRGENVDTTLPTLNLLHEPTTRRHGDSAGPGLWIAAFACAVMLAATVIKWVATS